MASLGLTQVKVRAAYVALVGGLLCDGVRGGQELKVSWQLVRGCNERQHTP